MAAHTQDTRVQKTKRHLRQGLGTLIGKKHARDISVKELTDLTGMNRGTFYLHYRDIHDMLDKLEQETLGELEKLLEELPEKDQPMVLLQALLGYLSENASTSRLLLHANGKHTFPEGLCRLLSGYPPFAGGQQESSLNGSFLLFGCVGMVVQWVRQDFDVPLEELAELLVKLTAGSGKKAVAELAVPGAGGTENN